MMKKLKNAFTLAESLITMTIIGIIASLTLPALNANIQAHELKASYNHAYSTIADAERMFSNRYGVTFSKCTTLSGYGINKCMEDFTALFSDDTAFNKTYSTFSFKGGTGKSGCTSSMRSVNGNILYSFNSAPDSGYNGPRICVDINGVKRPNIVGVDVFGFVFIKDGGLIPEGTSHPNNSSQNPAANGTTNCSSSNPVACSYYAARNESPTGNGTYWEDFVGKKQYMKY